MKKPLVVLIRPYFVENLNQVTFPIGLAYLAASLKKANFRVQILDLNILKRKNAEIIPYLTKIKPNFIGITALTYYYPSMLDMCQKIKAQPELSKTPLILGGVHVTFLPELSLKQTQADFAVIGEGETTIIELLNGILNPDTNFSIIAGIGFFQNGEYIQTPCRAIQDNIDLIEMPDFESLHPIRYPVDPHGLHYKKGPVFPIFTTRGCPYECTYCASKNFWHQRIRFHSIKRVVDEIEILITKHGAKEIHIWDDNFTLKKKRVLEFCREIKKRGIVTHFACPNGVRIDTLDEQVLKYMHAVGFYSLTFAVESASPRIQKYVKKYLDVKIVPPILKTANDVGFVNRAFFMYNFPTETLNEVYETIRFATQLKVDHANFFMFTPLPGSTFFDTWIEEKDLESMKWNFDYIDNPYDNGKYSKIARKDLRKLSSYFLIKFLILNPERLIKLLLRIKFSQYLKYAYFAYELIFNQGKGKEVVK